MAIGNNWFQNLLSGMLTPFQSPPAGMGGKRPATFISPLTAGNQGTAAMGFAQGSFGSTPGQSPLQGLGIGGGGFVTGFGGFSSSGPPPKLPLGGSFGGHIRNTGQRLGYNPKALSAGTQFTGANASAAGYGSAYSSIANITGEMAKDSFGRPVLNPVNKMPIPSAPAAFRTLADGTRQAILDENGNQMASTLTSFQAEQAGLSVDELKASGYTQFGGTWVYNPVGGAGSGGNSNLSWWQKEGFESEKKANQYYTDKKRAEQKAKDREDPKKNGEFNKHKKNGYGVTVATSNMGTG